MRGLVASIAFGILLGIIGLGVWTTLPPRDVSPATQATITLPPAQTQLAARPLPPVLPPAKPELLPPPKPEVVPPAWLRFAVASPPVAQGHARIAIVIDDLGLDRKRTEQTIALKGPLTLSFLAYANDLPHLTEAARQAGHELLVHVPMEPMSHARGYGAERPRRRPGP